MLRRAALLFELAKRRAKDAALKAGENPDDAELASEDRDLGVHELLINDPSCLNFPSYSNPLTITPNSQYVISDEELNDIGKEEE